jgi:hypothetical protein
MTLVGFRGAEAGTCGGLPAWGIGNPMPTPVYGHAVASDGTYVYSAGGTSVFPGCADTASFRRYDPTNDSIWTSLAPVPFPVVGATLAYDANGKRLFLFGGLSTNCTAMNLVQVYDIASDAWSPGPAMPATRSGMGSGVIGGRIYLVGGHIGGFVTPVQDQNWEFDPAKGKYTVRASLPSSLAGPASAVSGGRLYIMGGRTNSTVALDSNYEYTPSIDTWVARAPLPIAVSGSGGTALGQMAPGDGDIIVVGGQTLVRQPGLEGARKLDDTDAAQVYDVAEDRWSSGPSLSAARRGVRAARVGNTLVALGGHDGFTTVTTVDTIQGSTLASALQLREE